jgi:hypothetical protein
MRKREHFAFLDGYKPALLVEPKHKFFNLIPTNYPHLESYIEQDDIYIFFQTEELKNEYVKKVEGVSWGTYEFHKIIGEALGFPKKSVEFYARMRVLEDKIGHYPEEEEQTKVGVAWAGFFFSSHLDFVEQEVHWLFNTYQHEKAVGLPLYLRTSEDGYIEIPYGNFEKLNLVVNTIKADRKQKTIATA